MYKTIRHGENSLQYTILPQNDDFRIEGKLSSAESKGKGSGKSRKPTNKRPRRRSFFAYLGLIFVCTVIVGAILIPFLVSAECLPIPTEWFLKTKAALTRSKVDIRPDVHHGENAAADGVRGNVDKLIKIINKDGTSKVLILSNNSSHTINLNTTLTANKTNVSIKTQAYPESNTSNNLSNSNLTVADTILPIVAGNAALPIADKDATITHETEIPQQQLENQTPATIVESNGINNDNINQPTIQTENFVTEIRFDAASAAMPPHLSAVVPTIVVTTVRAQDTAGKAKSHLTVRPTSSLSAANVNSPRLSATGSFGTQAAGAPAMPTIVTRIIQVPLLKSASKKPIIPPVLAKTNSQYISVAHQDGDGVAAAGAAASDSTAGDDSSNLTAAISSATAKAKSSTKSNWIHTHWPYIDPSTYVQWNDYKAEDSVLLPALLGFALICMFLITTVCLVTRNKCTMVSSARKRNRNDVEEAGAEDATLLTATNLSDED